MESHNLGKERLIVPTDFTSPAASKNVQEDLVPPSHFASIAQSAGAHRRVQHTGTPPPTSWMNPGVTSVFSADPTPVNPWLAITQAQQEILELRKENQRIMMLHENSIRGRPADRSEQWSRWESEWRLEAEKHKAEAERLKGQVEALKESAGRHREDIRDRDNTMNRQGHELDAVREELCKAKTELSQIREELIHSSAQKEKISSQLERLKTESGEEIKKLRRDVERRKEETQELALKAEMGRLQAEEEAKQQSLRLSEHLEEKLRKQEVERLNKEKAALQMTAELLTVRLNSVNEILALQEEKMAKKFRSMEQELQQEQHRASVLQHSLDDRIAELDLERVEKETLKRDLAQAYKENSQLKSQSQKSEAELKILTDAVHRFSLAFQNKVAEVDTAQARLNTFTQRVMFAKRRVETIQGLIMRRMALQKVHQASKQAGQAAHSITNLQTELSLVCEERDKLTQELKRTPELIEKALADLKEQYESKQKQQRQELEQSWVEVQQAVAGREKAEQSLQQIQAQLEETKVDLEELRSELLIQQERSEHALQERVSEIEDRCAEKLREMEVQINTARREHTKAVMTLRQFERDAARKQEMRETQYFGGTHTKRDVENKQLKETEKDKNLLLATVAERSLMSEYPRVHTTTLQNFAVHRERQKPSERSCSVGAKVQVPADERLLSVLEELHTLSAAVVNSSEDSAEEEGQNNSVGPSAGSLHS
ncbi:hypothetical protein INR49_015626 [Caranx melampygus]|nr:hypothetical protein INR49_015626 [Caranx melampygus]